MKYVLCLHCQLPQPVCDRCEIKFENGARMRLHPPFGTKPGTASATDEMYLCASCDSQLLQLVYDWMTP